MGGLLPVVPEAVVWVWFVAVVMSLRLVLEICCVAVVGAGVAAEFVGEVGAELDGPGRQLRHCHPGV